MTPTTGSYGGRVRSRSKESKTLLRLKQHRQHLANNTLRWFYRSLQFWGNEPGRKCFRILCIGAVNCVELISAYLLISRISLYTWIRPYPYVLGPPWLSAFFSLTVWAVVSCVPWILDNVQLTSKTWRSLHLFHGAARGHWYGTPGTQNTIEPTPLPMLYILDWS